MTVRSSGQSMPGFRSVPKTGVIYVMTEAKKRGYSSTKKDWANLGQGAPETGSLPQSPPRLYRLSIDVDDLEYSPVPGLDELRQAVADLYNQRYRKGRKSQYTLENVAISSGGRLGLTRVVSTLGRTHVGHFLPDYTAYEELLDAFGTFVPIPLQLERESAYKLSPKELERYILGLGLSTVLLSNPCNPTGTLLIDEELESWVGVMRKLNTSVIFDEFYSHYIYDNDRLSLSAAEYVEDVDRDSVIILDGLTKNWRYPGLRVSWTLAPKPIIEAISSAGSFLDGGCARPLQRSAIGLVNKDAADAEARAIKSAFSAKRQLLIEGLEDLGISVDPKPSGGFYCWGNLDNLPEEINSGMKLFEKGLEVGLITVPGLFFDINPGKRRPDRPSRFRNYTRFSFGPSMQELELGLSKLRRIVGK